MENTQNVFSVTEEEVLISFEVTDEKPFNKCFQCQSFLKDCSGPNLLIMGVERACEFLQMVRIFTQKSYQQVAECTGISLTNVKKTLTGKNENPSMITFVSLTKCLLGSSNGRKYPCAIPNINPAAAADERLVAAARELEAIAADNEKYQKALDEIHSSYNAEMSVIRAEAAQRIAAAEAEAERWRIESEGWRFENDRKGKLIDKYLDKMIGS